MQNAKPIEVQSMMRKALLKCLAALAAVAASCAAWTACSTRSSRLIAAAEELALTNPDSAALVLAQADTCSLGDATRARLALAQALIHEEKWLQHCGDTAVCLHVTDTAWEFRRVVVKQRCDSAITHDDDSLLHDSTLLRAYYYYERASLGGTSDDQEALRLFGRTCYVLSRRFKDNDTLLQFDQLIHLAIHAAEAAEDWGTAYRAYHRWAEHCDFAHGTARDLEAYWSLCQALKAFSRSSDSSRNLLTLLNDYGRFYLAVASNPMFIDPRGLPILQRAAEMLVPGRETPDYDEVLRLVDSAQNYPQCPYSCNARRDYSGRYDMQTGNVSNIFSCRTTFKRLQQAKEKHEAWVAENPWYSKSPLSNLSEHRIDALAKTARTFDIESRNYLAPGYVLKASVLLSRLMKAVIAVLLLVVALLLLMFWNWHSSLCRRHEAERAERQREAKLAAQEAERFSEQLRQKDTMIALLRGHIMDKSELLERLQQNAGNSRRTVINARNWREIEATLDSVDNGFVSRLRLDYPHFSEDDIRLCMLTRLKLSNTALSAIYVISISAVQHRKQKLKKDGFGVSDPAVSLEQIVMGL